MNKLRRDKRAYVAYLLFLLTKQDDDPECFTEDNNPIGLEILAVEKHISDLEFVIEVNATTDA